MTKKNIMKRQAMTVTTKQLRLLADALDKEAVDSKLFKYTKKELTSLKWLITIINKEPKCSDTWEIER